MPSKLLREKPKTWLVILAVTVIFLLVLLVMDEIAPYRSPLPSTDSAIFLYMGDQLLDGNLLYKDAWDHKGPIVFLINAVGLLVRENSLWGIWLIQFLAVASAAYIGFIAMRKVFGIGPAFFGTVVWLLALRPVLNGGNLTEEYALPFQFAAILFFWRALNQDAFWDWFWLGLSASLAFWLRANIIGIQVAIGLILIWQIFKHKDKTAPKRLGSIALGWAAVSGLILAWFVFQENLPGLIDATFVFNFIYSHSTLAEKWDAFLSGLRLLSFAASLAIMGWALLAADLFPKYRNKPNARMLLLGFLLLAFPIEFGLASMSGRALPHYYMSLLPIVALLTAFFALRFLSLVGESGSREKISPLIPSLLLAGLFFAIAFLPALSLISSGFATVKTVIETGNLPVPVYGGRSERVLNYLAQNLEPDDGLVMWGKNLIFNWATDHSVPSRHIFQDHFFAEGYATSELIEEYISDLDLNRPMIIDTTLDNHFVPPIGTPLQILPEVVRPLYQFIATNYQSIGPIPGTNWEVYQYQTAGP